MRSRPAFVLSLDEACPGDVVCRKPFPSWEGPGVGSEFKVQGSKFKVRCSVLVFGCWVLKSVRFLGGARGGFRVQGSKFKVPGSRFKVGCWLLVLETSSPPGRGQGWVSSSKFKVQGWILDVGCCMLVAGCCKPFPSWEGPGVGFKVQNSRFKVGRWMLVAGCEWSVVSGRTLNVGPLSPLGLLNVSTSPVQRTSHSQPRLLHYVRVYLGRSDVLVPEQLLDRPDVITGFQKARRERMSQRMATGGLDDSSKP